jgi:hypothetical protein
MDGMNYELAKWLFPKLRPDEGFKRLNTIILVAVVSALASGILVAVMLVNYARVSK